MEYIKKEELIKGEIYKNTNNDIIFKCLNDKTSQGVGFRIINKCFVKNNWFSSNLEYLLATPEEKHWLNTCIEQNKFITFEEAMKTFTVEEKVIEPLPQFKIIESIETITKVENNEGNQFFIGDLVIGIKSKIKSKIISFKYNVDKTTILAITDKTLNMGIGINHLEHYIEPKVKVKNEFNNFKIGDTIKLKLVTYNDNTYKIVKIVNNVLFYKGNDIYTNSHRVLFKNAIKVN